MFQADELDSAMNSLLLDSQPEVIEREEEVISLQPIGRGVHNLEPSTQSPPIKTSPVTAAFPTDGLYLSTSLSVCLSVCLFVSCCLTYALAFAVSL